MRRGAWLTAGNNGLPRTISPASGPMRVKQLIPRGSGLALLRAWYAARDLAEWARGRRDPLVPPRRMSFRYGGGDFRKQSEILKQGAIGAGLIPSMRVLDVGCGIGRFALPLVDYLDPSKGGSYDGFDIIREGIEWCRETISARYPHFRFVHVDVFNPHYNARGRLDARTFRFPYPDGSFDFVLLSSVFTHLLPEQVEHYLSEIARTSAPGARTYITWFLRTPESLAGIAAGKAHLDIRHDRGNFAVMDPDLPEKAVAYDVDWVMEHYRRCGLRVAEPIGYGKWSGRQDRASFQDVVIADRV